MPRKKSAKSVRKPTQKRSKETVDAILEATARVLEKRGYAGTTTNHIARKAGIGIATFYSYFPDKDAAIAAVVDRFVDESLAIMIQEGTGVLAYQPMEALKVGLRRGVEIAVAKGPLLRVLYQQVPFVWELPKVRRVVSVLMELGKRYTPVQEFVPPEEVTEERLYLMIVLIGALVVTLAVDPRIQPRREAIVDEFVELVGIGYRAWLAERGER